MNAFKRIAIAALVVTATLSLTACSFGSTEADGSSNSVGTYAVTLTSGTIVDCAVFDGYKTGGVTCFWGEESTATETTDLLTASVENGGGIKRDCVVFDGYQAGGIDCDKSQR